MSHDHLVFIADDGSCHTIRAFDVPERSRAANGVLVAGLLPKLKPGASVAAVVPLSETTKSDKTLLLLTAKGKAKRLAMDQLGCASRSSAVPCFSTDSQLARRMSSDHVRGGGSC